MPPWAIVRKARNMNSGRGTPGEEEPLPASFSTVVKVDETARRSTVRGRRLYTPYCANLRLRHRNRLRRRERPACQILEDGSVDAAFANMVLHHGEYPAAMPRERVRVVRPGGKVTITDEVEHPYTRMRDEHADVWPGFGSAPVEHFYGEARLEGYGCESL